jgi:hypothetical protein
MSACVCFLGIWICGIQDGAQSAQNLADGLRIGGLQNSPLKMFALVINLRAHLCEATGVGMVGTRHGSQGPKWLLE